jgi:hypothetical protein
MFDVYKRYKNDLTKIPSEYQTEETYIDMIRYHKVCLCNVPLKTKQICIEAVKQNWLNLPDVPKEQCCEELYFEAIKKEVASLRYVPIEYCTDKICYAAVLCYDDVLGWIEKEYRTKNLCRMATKYSLSITLKYVPDEWITQEMCIEAVNHNCANLEFVPKKWITEEICLIAVTQNGYILKHVPEELRSYNLCFIATKTCGDALEYVPEVSHEICLNAVRNKGTALRYATYVTEEICIEALKQDYNAIEYVPECFYYKKIFDAYFSSYKGITFDPPWKIKSEKLYLNLVQCYGPNIKFVPERYLTQRVVSAAIKSHGLSIGYIDKSKLSAKLYLEAVKQNGNALQYVSKYYISEEICIAALEWYGNYHCDIPKHVPKELYTEKIRSLMLANNYKETKSFGIKTSLPEMYHIWLHFPKSKDIRYFKDNLKKAKKFSDLKIESFFNFTQMFDVFKYYDKSIDKIPDELRTEETFLDIVRYHNVNLSHIPIKYRTKEICIDAVKRNAHSIPDVPKDLCTEELYLEAIKKDAIAIQYVDDPSDKLCHAAVISNDNILDDIDTKYITEQLCKAAVKYSKHVTLGSVPKKWITYAMCIEALGNNIDNLEYVPNVTYDIWLIAVTKNGSAIKWIPKEYRSFTLCFIATKTYGCALKYIPDCIVTYEMRLNAVKADGYALRWILDDDCTEELCICALNSNAIDAISYVPERFYYTKVSNAYFSNYTKNTFDPPTKIESKQFYDDLIAWNGRNIRFVPKKYITNELLLAAVKQDGTAIEFIDERLTEEMCIIALKQHCTAVMCLIPERLYTEKVVSLMIANDPNVKKKYNLKSSTPSILHRWTHFKGTKDNIYFIDNLKTATKFSDTTFFF